MVNFEHNKIIPKTWEGIKSIININTTKNKSIDCLNKNNTEETDLLVLNSSISRFFTTIAKKKKKKKKKKKESSIVHKPKNYTDHLTNPSENSFFLTPTSPDEAEDIIKTLKLRKSIGPNSIPTKPFKKYSIPISRLINEPFVTGTFPEPLKPGSLTTISKKEDLLEYTNYQLKSLTSNISKFLEQLVHKSLYHS